MPIPSRRMQAIVRGSWTIAALCVAALLGGCAADPASGTGQAARAHALFSEAQEVEIANIAAALARALGEERHREVLRTLLQRSSLTEHKVVFSAFVQHAEARSLVADVERHANIASGTLSARVRNLPALDIYMLAKQHRNEWTPEQPVIVAPHLREEAPRLAFRADGSTEALRLEDGELPRTALVAIQFSEPKQRRLVRTVAGSRMIQDRLERALVIGNAECDPELSECGEGGGGGGGGGGGCIYTYRIAEIATFDLEDNNNPFEGNEIEVHAADGSVLDYGRVTEVGADVTVFPDEPIICTSTNIGGIDFHVIETDAWPNPDDQFARSDSLHVFQLTTGDLGDDHYFYSYPGPLTTAKMRIVITRTP